MYLRVYIYILVNTYVFRCIDVKIYTYVLYIDIYTYIYTYVYIFSYISYFLEIYNGYIFIFIYSLYLFYIHNTHIYTWISPIKTETACEADTISHGFCGGDLAGAGVHMSSVPKPG